MKPVTRWSDSIRFLDLVHADCSILVKVVAGIAIYHHRYVIDPQDPQPIIRASLVGLHKPAVIGFEPRRPWQE